MVQVTPTAVVAGEAGHRPSLMTELRSSLLVAAEVDTMEETPLLVHREARVGMVQVHRGVEGILPAVEALLQRREQTLRSPPGEPAEPAPRRKPARTAMDAMAAVPRPAHRATVTMVAVMSLPARSDQAVPRMARTVPGQTAAVAA